ncbi:MAG TPA: YihY/virulence factor BrkB family protein [Longimicrobium sp.]|nr:YihY/virulence factor BrkB family protein [Longimicrobium sp.]
MKVSPKELFSLLKTSLKDFSDDECPRLAAALSYYTVFSLPPLLILILTLVGAFMDPADVQGALAQQIEGLMGPTGAEEVQTMIARTERPGRGLAAVLGVGALIFGATGAFIQLQAALNRAWEVEPDPKRGGWKNFVFKRLLSLGMVLSIAFLLLVSLAVSAALSAFSGALGRMLPGSPGPVFQTLSFVVSFAVITLLFACMFKVLPDARIAWRDVWVGAFVTALLFTLGKFALGMYLGRSNPGEAYGAAGSLALILVWIYYSAMILLFGAEFTQTWAMEKGGGIEPEEGARRMADETGRQLAAEGKGAKA